jgi:peroxin-11B
MSLVQLAHDRRLAHVARLSNKLWIGGILLSLVSTSSSLVKLRADSRRFALGTEMAMREAATTEKGPEEKQAAQLEMRERGRALLACVLPL